jgi:hypothetical protein
LSVERSTDSIARFVAACCPMQSAYVGRIVRPPSATVS